MGTQVLLPGEVLAESEIVKSDKYTHRYDEVTGNHELDRPVPEVTVELEVDIILEPGHWSNLCTAETRYKSLEEIKDCNNCWR